MSLARVVVAACAVLCSAAADRSAIVDGRPSVVHAVIVAGGGPAGFKTLTLLGVLAGADAHTEASSLTRHYGATVIQGFIRTLDFALDEMRREPAIAGLRSPSTLDPQDGQALVRAIYVSGLTRSGREFDATRMLDTLLSRRGRIALERDVDRRFGTAARRSFESVLATAVRDLRARQSLEHASHTDVIGVARVSFVLRYVAVSSCGCDDSSFGGSCELNESRPPLPVNVCAL